MDTEYDLSPVAQELRAGHWEYAAELIAVELAAGTRGAGEIHRDLVADVDALDRALERHDLVLVDDGVLWFVVRRDYAPAYDDGRPTVECPVVSDRDLAAAWLAEMSGGGR